MKPTVTTPGQPAKPLIEEKSLEQIAAEIETLSEALRTLNASRLRRRAVLVLIKDACPTGAITLSQIDMVLNKASELKAHYLK